MENEKVREQVAKAIHRKNDLCHRNGAEESWDSGYECSCFEMADAAIATLASASPAPASLPVSEVQNILMEVCQILSVKLGPGLARYAPLIARVRELAHAAPASAAPQVVIEARWEDGVWKVDIDKANRNSGFACKDTLINALNQAVEIAVENYTYRRDKAGEKLEGIVRMAAPSSAAPTCDRCGEHHKRGESCAPSTAPQGTGASILPKICCVTGEAHPMMYGDCSKDAEESAPVEASDKERADEQQRKAILYHLKDWPSLGDCEWNCTTMEGFQEAIGRINAAAYRRGQEEMRELHVSDVLNALVEMTDGVLWKQPEADGHVTRFTALLNEKWKAAAVRALPVSEEKP